MPMRTLLAAFAAFALPAALLAATGPESGREKPFETQMQPGDIHEECVRLEQGKSRAFEWTSDGPVDFNIHFHSGERVSYPVRLKAQTKAAGRFTAKTGEDYCWMWTARRPTRVTGRIGAEE